MAMDNSRKNEGPYQAFILDLDGTMIPSAEIDNQCYWQSVHDVLGNAAAPVDLREFEHVTDSGILEEWVRREFGRAPLESEFRAVRIRFLELTQEAAKLQPLLFRPLAGLEDWIESVVGNENMAVGIATGGWAHTAKFKLAVSGLDRFDLPLASSDDAVSRTGIMSCALERLRSQTGKPGGRPARACYVGDGPWDYAASRELGWNFIGIADGARAASLKGVGAMEVVADFRQLPIHKA
jgi:beta-phosphoglucomutase-like phosphatase (HAD superfamily)